jgi:FecR protein
MMSRSIFQSHRATLAALVLLSMLGVSVALADDESDPPGRVARLSYADGAVSLQPAGVDDWADATINRPLTTGDKLWTDQNSRAELDIGSAAIRLGSTTGLSFLNLDDQSAQLNVTAGTAIVHVRDLGENQSFEIDTPNVAVLLQSPGDYRVEVNDSGNSTVVKVSNGDAQVSATGQTVPLHTQQAFAFNGTDQVTVDQASVGAPDALDSWSIDRDHRSEQAQAQSSQYVSPDVAGADDLAQYGTWDSTPEYGDVWTPTAVPAGWSPYQDGRWVWVSPWGWTWVDAAPWGFAPFHYGRWAYRGTRWCWVPGPRHVRAVYAPALVAWVGSPGANVSISVGGGAGVGWFPLGPREVYVPGYRVSNNYVRNVNISNTTFVNNTYITNVYENRITNITYVNRNRPGAVVAVSQDVFTSARPISGRTMRIPANELSRFNAHGVGPAIAPVRESVLGRRPDMNVRRPPAAYMSRPVVARTAPPPGPVSFDRQQAAIRANGGRPLGRSQITALQPQAAAVNSRVRVVAPSPIRPIQNGQRFGTARPEENLQSRERALHATPMPPSSGSPSPNAASPSPQSQPSRNDRPATQMRNDQYRMQNTEESRRQAQEVRPAPQATPVAPPQPQFRTQPQARPFEQQARPVEQQRFEQPRATLEPQPPRATPLPQASPVEQPRAQFRPPEPPRPIQRPVEQPRPEARAIEQPREQPRAVPQPQPRAAPPPQPRPAAPQARAEDRRGRPQERGDPRRN